MEDHVAGISSLFAPLVNVSILVGVIFYKTKTPILEMIKSRHETIKTTLVAVAQSLKASQAQYEEYKAKLDALDIEAKAIFDEMRQDANAIQIKRLNDAKKLSAQILVDAKEHAQNMVSQFQDELRTETVELVMDRIQKDLLKTITGAEKAVFAKSIAGAIVGRST